MPTPLEKGWDSCRLIPHDICIEVQIFSSQKHWLPFCGHLLILEVTNCETKVAGKVLYVCENFSLHGSFLQSFLPQSFPWCVCVHAHVRGLLIATNSSVPFLWDLSESRSVQCSAQCLIESLRSLKAFRRVSKKQHTHITENT